MWCGKLGNEKSLTSPSIIMYAENKGRFCNDSKIETLISKRLSVKNKAKLETQKTSSAVYYYYLLLLSTSRDFISSNLHRFWKRCCKLCVCHFLTEMLSCTNRDYLPREDNYWWRKGLTYSMLTRMQWFLKAKFHGMPCCSYSSFSGQ